MLPVNKLLSCFTLFCISLSAVAQQHYNAWFRGSLSIPAGKTFRTDLEFQYRRQNGPGNANLLDKNLMFTMRGWIHYQPKETFKISVSPFAYFSHYKIIQKQGDEHNPPVSEFRVSVAAELRYKIWEPLIVFYRPVIEVRFPEPFPSYLIRLRNRIGSGYPISSKFNVMVYDELFFHIAGAGLKRAFDHNRSCISFEYRVAPRLKLEAGYIYILRLPMTSDTRIYENNFFINVTWLLKKCEHE